MNFVQTDMMKHTFEPLIITLFLLSCALGVEAETIAIRLDAEEPEVVLAIADAIVESGSAPEPLWSRLWETAGYLDLAYREEKMGRGFTKEEFREFVRSEAVVERRHELRETLERWKSKDMVASARRALRYLPADATIDVAVYPLIKPKSNSFVFETPRGKAIFLYLDPEKSGDEFENTVTHELHHIGQSTACDGGDSEGDAHRAVALKYLGAFGEGIATLAAAGTAEIHPHATSSAEARATWNRNMGKVGNDIERLESFFSEILSGELEQGSEPFRSRFMELINEPDAPQGAFYTVGYTMASTIERELGREALVAVICEPARLLELYDEIAAREEMPQWSAELLRKLNA